MKRLTPFLLLLALAAFMVWGVVSCNVATRHDRAMQQLEEQAARRRDQLQAQRDLQDQAQWEELDEQKHRHELAKQEVIRLWKTWLVVTLFLVAISILLWVGALPWLWTVAAWQRGRHELVMADAAGMLPVAKRQVVHGHFRAIQDEGIRNRMLLAHEQATRALPGPVPEHYAPSFSYHAGNRRNDPHAMLEDGVPAVLVEAPPFARLLDTGAIHVGSPILLGYSDQGALTGNWKDLYSSAVAGATGSGKTTTTRFLACQSALHGARFVILDPHGDAGEESLAGTLQPLSAAFVMAPAIEERDMLHAVSVVSRELDHRLSGKDGPPWIVAIDEFTGLMARGELSGALARLIEKIAQEGRKKSVFALLNGQIWRGDRAGGTALRDSLASAYVHRIRRNQARFLLPTADAARAESLPTGQALLYRTSGDVLVVSIPNTTAADVERVAGLLPTPLSVKIEREGEIEGGAKGNEGAPLTEEDRRIIDLLGHDTGPHQIIKEVWDISGGAAYKERAEYVRRLTGRLVRGEIDSHIREE